MMIPASALSILRVATLAPALSLAGPSDLAAQASGSVYVRRDECVAAGRLTAEQCEFAYRNARAEFLQKAPRYASRAACERSHKRCAAQMVSAGGWESFGKGGATYVPRFVGVRVTGEGAASKALPVIEGERKSPSRCGPSPNYRSASPDRHASSASPAMPRAARGGMSRIRRRRR